ncbi:OpgC domain-containing protein [Falsirhodobacter algicola]|uniref:OpgC protein n=1 Tax=Falsirhodobacter algicola TaxID=2692330 RepID=A0A8J8MW78_9RHOB|nr:OpgC domain-containing protein [Falsirhodobacter algicola]QUS37293.1 hypothetical protein GR316_13000 [Falsirhodobacter algicola]
MMRMTALDGLRGWFLITMTLSHVVLQQGVWLDWLHFRNLMFVESAQGFVFLSGLLFGMVQYRRLIKQGPQALWQSAGRRVLELWCWAVGLLILVLMARNHLPNGAWIYRNWLGQSGLEDPIRVAAIATTIFQPTFMDILPQYMIYIAVAPAVLLLVRRELWPLAAALSIIVWMSAQLGLVLPLSRGVDLLAEARDGQGLRMAFDPMGWQLLFMGGVIVGSLWQRGTLRAEHLFPAGPAWPLAALAVMLFFLPLRVLTAHGWLDPQTLGLFAQMERRSNLGPVYVMNFVAAAWLMGWLLHRGAEAAPVIQRIAAGLRRLVGWEWAALLGRHSLQTYVWHVVLVYALRYADAAHGPLGPVQATLGVAVALLLLPLPACLLEGRFIRRPVAPARQEPRLSAQDLPTITPSVRQPPVMRRP